MTIQQGVDVISIILRHTEIIDNCIAAGILKRFVCYQYIYLVQLLENAIALLNMSEDVQLACLRERFLRHALLECIEILEVVPEKSYIQYSMPSTMSRSFEYASN